MKSQIQFFIFFLILNSLQAQNKQDYIWLGGLDPSPSEEDVGFRFDFNVKPFEVMASNNGFRFVGNIASICDKEGNLLFYSNGCAIINAEAHMMPNGDSINYNEWYTIFTDGECKYGYPGSQDIMILPDPGYGDGYYVFHKANVYFPVVKDSFELLMSYVDMTLDDGRGDVVFKNKPYHDLYNMMYSYFTAIQHINGKDWWIIQPLTEDSLFLTFLLTENGLEKKTDQNTNAYFNHYRSSASGSAKFSPDGTKYALYNYYDQLHLYDFNRLTGKFSNHIKINVYDEDSIDVDDIRFSSVEWSPNSRFIYTASRDELHQIDTWEEDMQDGTRLIDVYNGTQDPFPTPFYLMAQGPDCRIYMRPTNGSNSYHVINHPDSLGTSCDFVQNGIKLPIPSGGGLPNFPRFRVDDEEKCDPTIVSVFGNTVWYRRDLMVYPNPSDGLFNIELPDNSRGKIAVTNIYSAILKTKNIELGVDKTNIDISNLPTGIYNIEYYPENNKERVFYSTQVVISN